MSTLLDELCECCHRERAAVMDSEQGAICWPCHDALEAVDCTLLILPEFPITKTTDTP